MEPKTTLITNWCESELSHGSYVNKDRLDFKDTCTHINNFNTKSKIVFAGEYCSERDANTTLGAYESGISAALQLLDTLQTLQKKKLL
jgi:hypothetical protein